MSILLLIFRIKIIVNITVSSVDNNICKCYWYYWCSYYCYGAACSRENSIAIKFLLIISNIIVIAVCGVDGLAEFLWHSSVSIYHFPFPKTIISLTDYMKGFSLNDDLKERKSLTKILASRAPLRLATETAWRGRCRRAALPPARPCKSSTASKYLLAAVHTLIPLFRTHRNPAVPSTHKSAGGESDFLVGKVLSPSPRLRSHAASP